MFLLPLILFIGPLSLSAEITAGGYDTFLEPNMVVELSSPFRDRLHRLHVREGEQVSARQLTAEFDTRVLKARLSAAEIAASSTGQIEAAQASLVARKNRLAMLEKLEESGNARPQEMISARTELTMAKATLQSRKEEQKVRQVEVKVIKAQIEEKMLRSPINGVVLKIYRQQAELVGGGEEQGLMTIAQLDPLKAVFHLPPAVAQALQPTESIELEVNGQQVSGQVKFISPVINAQSNTVELQVIIPNDRGQYKSGSRCTFTPPV